MGKSKAEKGFEIYFLSEKASDPEAERLAEFENSVLAMEDKDRVDQDAAGILYALARTEFINEVLITFCADHGIVSDIETIPIDKVNEAQGSAS